MGLHLAGFEVVGVDIRPQPKYPFEFVQADALSYSLRGFDFVWASPPCQFASEATHTYYRSLHKNRIPGTRAKLLRSRLPYIMENVENAREHLRDPIMLCGSMFRLRCRRHRYFECNPALRPHAQCCDHRLPPLLVTTAGANSRAAGNFKSTRNAVKAYGIDWMTVDGLTQAIPPAYSEFLGRQVMSKLRG